MLKSDVLLTHPSTVTSLLYNVTWLPPLLLLMLTYIVLGHLLKRLMLAFFLGRQSPLLTSQKKWQRTMIVHGCTFGFSFTQASQEQTQRMFLNALYRGYRGYLKVWFITTITSETVHIKFGPNLGLFDVRSVGYKHKWKDFYCVWCRQTFPQCLPATRSISMLAQQAKSDVKSIYFFQVGCVWVCVFINTGSRYWGDV